MQRFTMLKMAFVEIIPNHLEPGTIYISIPYATAIHKCCCGCGCEVVTPFSRTDWTLSFDGETISLDPSIGNWSFPCKSHYWIKNSQIQWAQDMSKDQILAGREYDRVTKIKLYGNQKSSEPQCPLAAKLPENERTSGESLWSRLAKWWRG